MRKMIREIHEKVCPTPEDDQRMTAREAMEHLGYSNQIFLKADVEKGLIRRWPRDGRSFEYSVVDVKTRKKQLDELRK